MHWLRKFRASVAAHAPELCRLAAEEVRKTEFEALTGDVLPLLASCRWHERHAARVLATGKAVGKPWFMLGQSAECQRAPVGTVAIIATWNYPIQLLGIQVVQALVCGNRVVVKPSERAPRTQARLLGLLADVLRSQGRAVAIRQDLAQGAGEAPGIGGVGRRGEPRLDLEVLPATREGGAQLLMEHETGVRRLDHVVFTGSTAVGRTVALWGARNLVPTTLELSGRDSAFVLDGADAELAARAIWYAATVNAGQTCMAPRRALVDHRVYERFVRTIRALAAGAPARELIDAAAAERCSGLAVEAVRQGGLPASGVLERANGARLRPICILGCPADAEIVQGEHFGPVLPVICTQGFEEALEIHRRHGPHLATSVFCGFGAEARRWRRRAAEFGSSQVNINDALLPTAHPGTVIAGVGESGWGSSRGPEGLLALSRPVSVSSTGRRIRTPLQEPPARVMAGAAGWVKRLFG